METAHAAAAAALREGRAFVRPRAHTISVRGDDAELWLNDLATAGVASLRPGDSVRSLVLTPTGRIRADVVVLRTDGGFLLVQSVDQPERVDDLLGRYLLSSAVELADAHLAAVLLPSEAGWRATLEPPSGAVEIDERAAERWRIESAVARFPVDLDEESLPAEAGLDVPPVTDTRKGCFLGQESVARVRNLGHPTRVVVAFKASQRVAAGAPVTTDGGAVGVVTSATDPGPNGVSLLARIRWDARDAAHLSSGATALRRG